MLAVTKTYRRNMLFKTNWNIIYDRNLPFFRMMAIFGMWPVFRAKNGIFQFRWRSLRSFYTIFVLTIYLLLTGLTAPTLLKVLLAGKMNFENGVLFSAMLSHTVVNIIPVFPLIKAKKIAEYLNDWDHYQVFYEISLKKIEFPPKCTYWQTALLFFGSLSGYFGFILLTIRKYNEIIDEVSPENRKLFYICVSLFFFSMLTLFSYSYLWFLLTSNIRAAGETLLADLETKISEIRIIEPYHRLRLALRNLTEKLGTTFGLTYLYMIFIFYGMGLPVTYVAVTLAVTGDFTHSFAPFQQFGAISLLAHWAHRAVDKLGGEFENRLSRLLIQRQANLCEKELVAFIESVVSTPVVIPLNGFFNLDHGINVSLYSSVITFLVIIMQFREEKPSCGR